MTKGERRRARKAAHEAGEPLSGDLELRRGERPEEFSETHVGLRARERWARRHDELNGAPEGEEDR